MRRRCETSTSYTQQRTSKANPDSVLRSNSLCVAKGLTIENPPLAWSGRAPKRQTEASPWIQTDICGSSPAFGCSFTAQFRHSNINAALSRIHLRLDGKLWLDWSADKQGPKVTRQQFLRGTLWTWDDYMDQCSRRSRKQSRQRSELCYQKHRRRCLKASIGYCHDLGKEIRIKSSLDSSDMRRLSFSPRGTIHPLEVEAGLDGTTRNALGSLIALHTQPWDAA